MINASDDIYLRTDENKFNKRLVHLTYDFVSPQASMIRRVKSCPAEFWPTNYFNQYLEESELQKIKPKGS